MGWRSITGGVQNAALYVRRKGWCPSLTCSRVKPELIRPNLETTKMPPLGDVQVDLEEMMVAKTKIHGICHACPRTAKVKHECLTCEKKGGSHAVLCCRKHAAEGLETIRRHALVKHPGNIVGLAIAALKGEDVL